MVGPEGSVIALDLSRSGLSKVRALAGSQGLSNIARVRASCAGGIPLRYDASAYVLLDAPCTGIGTLREHPEIRWRLTSNDFARMAKLQLRMLDQAAVLIRAEGILVYSVCSLAPDEGEGVVNSFLESHREFMVDHTLALDERFAGLIGADGFMRTRPDRGGLDGFFAARIRRLG
jgi:16S rRNA (cytosine967-C5)-methyltransferase